MRGDFTRLRFEPHRTRYTAVLRQQGRVALDADHNEQRAIDAYLRETVTGDVVGACGVPADAPGFTITAPDGVPTIGAGRAYVDGLLAANAEEVTVDAQPDGPPGGALVRRTNGTWVALADAPNGTYLAYLDVWERHVIALDDPELTEVALGGPDTTTRARTTWQVRLAAVGPASATVGCLDTLPAWDAVSAPAAGTLQARAEPGEADTGPCVVPAGAGYRRLENQLYRVEIHDPGPVGTATWKASRDNGSVVRGLVARSGDDLVVDAPGRDATDGFPTGSWLELTDDTRELAGQPGTLVEVVRSVGTTITVNPGTATGTLDPDDFPRNPRVRRWDTAGARLVELPASVDGWLAIEDGVQVRFGAGATYRSGDFWTIPARTATGGVRWPAAGGAPAALPPEGVRHRRCRLAVLTRAGGLWTADRDCRAVFPPLTGLLALDYVSGDGQDCCPSVDDPAALVALPAPLVVGASTGSQPVVGARVAFRVVSGNGVLDGTGPEAEVATGADGTAAVVWETDSATPSQQVEARLLDAAGDPVHLPVVFTAEHRVADQVAYDPAACPDLAGTATVQEAIDRLCQVRDGGCATVTVSPGGDWAAPLRALPAGGDAVVCFRPGEYTLDTTLVLTGLGRLSLHGGGTATRIVAAAAETALRVEGAAALEVRDLAVVTGAARRVTKTPDGALTVVDTPLVAIEGCELACGPGTSPAVAAVAVRFAPARPGSARITGNRLVVGHGQIGVVVTDADRAVVSDNTLRVPARPRSLGLDRLVADRRVADLLAERLAREVVTGRAAAPAAEATTTIPVGRYVVAMNTPVPREQWLTLVAAQPPEEADLATPATVTAYADRLLATAVDEPARLPAFASKLDQLRGTLGTQRYNRLVGGDTGPAVLRNMVVTGEVAVIDSAAEPQVAVTVRGETVAFASELPARTWSQVVAAAPPDAGVDAAGAVRQAALRLVTDEDFRDRFAAVKDWFAGLSRANPAVAAQGIVVAGRTGRSVRVVGNTLDDVLEAVRVDVSRPASGNTPARGAGRVHISGNDATLRLPVERSRGDQAVFLGSCEHATVSDNHTSDVAGQQRHLDGVRVSGSLGPMLMVQRNLLQHARVGVRVDPREPSPNVHQWLVSDNASPDAEQAVVAPQAVRRHDNLV